MSDQTLVRGVVVAHAGLAEALVDAVGRIADPDEGALQAVSNEGLGPDGIAQAILDRAGEGPVIVFSDLSTGSCGFAARKLCGERAAYAMICGVNLPVLLDFVTHRDMPLGDLVARLVERAHRGISCLPMTSHSHARRPVSGG
jgi:mannose/fructose-specific phosphotransferase system component IIA